MFNKAVRKIAKHNQRTTDARKNLLVLDCLDEGIDGASIRRWPLASFTHSGRSRYWRELLVGFIDTPVKAYKRSYSKYACKLKSNYLLAQLR